MFDFSNYSAKSKYYDDSNKLVVGKMKDETNIHSFLVDDSSEHKKAKGVNKSVFVNTKMCHGEYKDVFLKKKCLRHLMNRIGIKIIQ